MITKVELKALIPHGKLKNVAEKAGVSSAAVTKFFNNQTISSFKIQKAALEVAGECGEEISTREKSLLNTINQ